jgi:hypothetical protein
MGIKFMDGFKVNTTSMHLVEAIVNCYAPQKAVKTNYVLG